MLAHSIEGLKFNVTDGRSKTIVRPCTVAEVSFWRSKPANDWLKQSVVRMKQSGCLPITCSKRLEWLNHNLDAIKIILSYMPASWMLRGVLVAIAIGIMTD